MNVIWLLCASRCEASNKTMDSSLFLNVFEARLEIGIYIGRAIPFFLCVKIALHVRHQRRPSLHGLVRTPFHLDTTTSVCVLFL